MSEVDKIAASLTKAQRELAAEGGSCVRGYLPGQKLVELGLWSDRGDEFVLWPDYTPLGLAVRAHLQPKDPAR